MIVFKNEMKDKEKDKSPLGAQVISLQSLEHKVCLLRFYQNLSIQKIYESTGLQAKSIMKLIENASRRLAREEVQIR